MIVKTFLRPLKDGKSAIHVSFLVNNERKRQKTGMFLYDNPKNKLEKDHNKETKKIEETFIAQLTVKIQNNELDPKPQSNTNDFIVFFTRLTEEREETGVNYDGWKSTLVHLKTFCPKGINFKDIDTNWLERFKHHLTVTKKLKGTSAQRYFNIVKHAIHKASRLKLIDNNIADLVKAPKKEDHIREYLTEEEIKKLQQTECKSPILKKAFLFSCITGMAHADLMKVYWKDIKKDHEGKWVIAFHRKKTKGLQHHQISDQAREMLGQAGEQDERVFKNLRYSAWMNMILREWVYFAGIKKVITFHCARHTYATLLLHKGVSITTVQELLGHSDIKTTRIYAKVMNEDKRKAAELIQLDFNN